MKNDNQVIVDRLDAEMMKRDHLWPQILLPLKRWRNNDLECGFLRNPGPPWVIHLGTIWGGAEGETFEYRTAEEAVADGWRVD